MRGMTNALRISGPDLEEKLNLYTALLRGAFLDTIQADIELLQDRIALLMNNPPVGSVTTFAGFDWVVVHWDTANRNMYFMLKDIYTRTTWADSASEHTPYENSNVKAELVNFENLLEIRLVVNLDTIELFDVSSVLVKRNGSFAFIPTKEELQSFAFFRQKAVASDNSGISFCGNAIVAAEKNSRDIIAWWLSGVGPVADDDCWFVGILGTPASLSGVAFETDSSNQYGVRPFICMKMR